MKEEQILNEVYEQIVGQEEDRTFMTISLDNFDKYFNLIELQGEEEQKALNACERLNVLLIEKLKKEGYSIYLAGSFYPRDGRFQTVPIDNFIAVIED